MEARNPITAIILAGGKSSRMGTDKGLTLFNNREMAQYAVDLAAPLFCETLLIANDPAYTKFQVPVYEDLITERGPLGGIFTGLTYSTTPWNFFIACDMPFMTRQVIEKLLLHLNDCDVVIPVHENAREPMCAFYNKSCLPVVEKQLSLNQNKLQELFPLLRIREVDFTAEFLSESNPFRNINTMDELLKLKKL